MRKLFVVVLLVTLCASGALAQSQQAPTLRIVTEDGTASRRVDYCKSCQPLLLRPVTNTPSRLTTRTSSSTALRVLLSRFPTSAASPLANEIISRPNAACMTQAENVSRPSSSHRVPDTGSTSTAHKAASATSRQAVPVRRASFLPTRAPSHRRHRRFGDGRRSHANRLLRASSSPAATSSRPTAA